MDVKLTLKLKEDVIMKIKQYAKKKNISVSKIVENYFNQLTSDMEEYKSGTSITPVVKELSGVLTDYTDNDHKESYTDYLVEKYK